MLKYEENSYEKIIVNIFIIILQCPTFKGFLNLKIKNICKMIPIKIFEYKYFYVDTNDVILEIEDQIFFLNENNTNINYKDVNILIFKCTSKNIAFNVDLTNLDLIGHRGFGENFSIHDVYVENTLKSFNKALENVKYVEMDVQLTKDKIPVIYHNFYFKNSNNRIIDLNINECNKNDLCQSLEHILENIQGGINLEIKYPQFEYLKLPGFEIPNYVNRIIDVIVKTKFKNLFFSTFHPLIAIYLKMKLPEAIIFFLISDENYLNNNCSLIDILNDAFDFCILHNLNGLVIDFNIIKNNFQEFLNIFKNKSLNVCVYNVKTKQEYITCKNNNITGVIVDDIAKMI